MDKDSSFSISRFEEVPVVGILRGFSREAVMRIAETYLEAGYTTLEVTLNTVGATATIEELRTRLPELHVGAGTVCSLEDFNRVVDVGAQFIVSPVMVDELIEVSVRRGLPIFPGALTPTEINKAWTLGATAVKVFPAGIMGPRYIREVLAPLDALRLLPTGGINSSNVREYLEAGAYGFGLGNSLFDRTLIESERYDELRAHFINFKQQIEAFRNDEKRNSVG